MGVLKLLLKIMGKLWVAVIIIIWCYKFLSIFVELAIYLSNILNFFYFSVLARHRKINVLMILRAQVQSLKDENERLKGQIKRLEKKQEACRCVVRPHCLSTFIKTDDDVNFYSEIPNIETFVRTFTGVYCTICHLYVICGEEQNIRQQKLIESSDHRHPVFLVLNVNCNADQFLLMWTKLRLNAPMRDLANRFGISTTTCSRYFSSWVRASATVLKSFVFVPDQGTINAVKPERLYSI